MISYNGFSSRIREQIEDPQVRTYLNLGLTLLAIILLSVFALRPALLTVYELSLKLTQAKQRSLELKNKISLLSQAQTNYQQVSPDIPLVLAALPKEPQLVKAFDIIHAAAEKSGVSIAKIDVGSSPVIATGEAGLRQATGIEIITNSDLPNIKTFLAILEKAARIMQVNKVNIQFKGEDYNSSIGIAIFYEL